MLKTDYQKKEEKTIILQKCLQLIAQFFLGRNDLAAKIFDLVPGAFIFVQIFAQGLDAHVTTVCEQVGDGGVLGIQCNLEIGGKVGHAGEEGIRRVAFLPVFLQEGLYFILQVLMRISAFFLDGAKLVVTDLICHLMHGRKPHLYAFVTFM